MQFFRLRTPRFLFFALRRLTNTEIIALRQLLLIVDRRVRFPTYFGNILDFSRASLHVRHIEIQNFYRCARVLPTTSSFCRLKTIIWNVSVVPDDPQRDTLFSGGEKGIVGNGGKKKIKQSSLRLLWNLSGRRVPRLPRRCVLCPPPSRVVDCRYHTNVIRNRAAVRSGTIEENAIGFPNTSSPSAWFRRDDRPCRRLFRLEGPVFSSVLFARVGGESVFFSRRTAGEWRRRRGLLSLFLFTVLLLNAPGGIERAAISGYVCDVQSDLFRRCRQKNKNNEASFDENHVFSSSVIILLLLLSPLSIE